VTATAAPSTRPAILARLRGVQSAGAGWLTYCPAHDDREHRSLSVGVGDDGRTLLHCHARACTVEAIAAAVRMTLADLGPTSSNSHRSERSGAGRVTRYEIRDPTGELVAVHVRQDRADGKRLWWERSDGSRGLGGRPVADLPLYRIERLDDAGAVVVTEGEPAADALTRRGIAAVGTVTGASATPGEASLRPLLGRPVVLWPDHDAPGVEHMRRIADSLRALGHNDVRTLRWPEARDTDDAADYFARGGTVDECRALIGAAEAVSATATSGNGHQSPWDAAQPIADFLAGDDDDVHYLDPLCWFVRGALTQCFSPRGLGKTHVLHALLVALARDEKRVLLLDRDNPRREIKRRLRAWGAAELTVERFRVMTRDDTPPLTDRAAWVQFPFAEYDAVAIDSLDASAEGVGEQDSAAPSRAIAVLLDLAHRADGPAVIVLGNTTKSGQAGRGSGIVEDRADIVYEIRDATDYTPTGTAAWWEELPPAARGDWASRATRRKRRDTYRLAIIATKHRVGPEPEPRVVEIDLTTQPWAWRDVTAELVTAGEHARQEEERGRANRITTAIAALVAELQMRLRAGTDMPGKKDAEAVLQAAGVTQKVARKLLDEQNGIAWRLTPRDGKTMLVTPVSEDRVTESDDSADPHKQRGFCASDSVGRGNSGQPHLPSESARKTNEKNTVEGDSPRVRAREDESEVVL
jgi:hypothetical protein